MYDDDSLRALQLGMSVGGLITQKHDLLLSPHNPGVFLYRAREGNKSIAIASTVVTIRHSTKSYTSYMSDVHFLYEEQIVGFISELMACGRRHDHWNVPNMWHPGETALLRYEAINNPTPDNEALLLAAIEQDLVHGFNQSGS